MRSVRCLRWLQQGGKTGICAFVCAWVAGLGAALYMYFSFPQRSLSPWMTFA